MVLRAEGGVIPVKFGWLSPSASWLITPPVAPCEQWLREQLQVLFFRVGVGDRRELPRGVRARPFCAAATQPFEYFYRSLRFPAQRSVDVNVSSDYLFELKMVLSTEKDLKMSINCLSDPLVRPIHCHVEYLAVVRHPNSMLCFK